MSTQSEKLTAIANAIRAKEGSSDPIPANDFPARIASIETGIQLPTLTNPGVASDLVSGKQLINQDLIIYLQIIQTLYFMRAVLQLVFLMGRWATQRSDIQILEPVALYIRCWLKFQKI